MTLVINTLNVVPPFTWANCTNQIPVDASAVHFPVGVPQSIDLLTIPPGLAGNMLFLYVYSGFVGSVGIARFYLRYPDLTTEEVVHNILSGTARTFPLELITTRLIEGAVLFGIYTRALSSVAVTGEEAVIGVIASIPGATVTGVGNVGISNTGEPYIPTATDLGNIFSHSATTFAASFPADHLVSFDPFGRFALGRFGANFSVGGSPVGSSSFITFQLGNVGSWTDIIIASIDSMSMGIGYYVAAIPADLRTFTVSHIDTTGSADFVALSEHSTVVIPLLLGRSVGQIIG